jgi:metallophosphoesterase (TIGR00282 family)
MNILLIGDIFGELGRQAFLQGLHELRKNESINYVVANGENIAHGTGITENYYHFLLKENVNVVTLGNHSFSNNNIFDFIHEADKLVRPINLPNGTPGVGYVTQKINGITITVFQVMGRTFMNAPLDCPFQKTEELLKNVKSDIYICDFHGEATSEKVAYGLQFDGRVQIIVGTHTHVQTNDAHLLPKGTMYMSDLGMTGALDGVIGVVPEIIIKRFVTGLPQRHVPMDKGRLQFCGLLVNIDESSHKVTHYDIVNMVY